MECDFEDAMACSPQPWSWLENREDKDHKISGRVWKVVETEAREIMAAKTNKEEKKKKRKRNKKRRSRRKKKRKKKPKRWE